nr:hypothetical protein BaRGS_034399 [Batillaria attramentaria]
MLRRRRFISRLRLELLLPCLPILPLLLPMSEALLMLLRLLLRLGRLFGERPEMLLLLDLDHDLLRPLPRLLSESLEGACVERDSLTYEVRDFWACVERDSLTYEASDSWACVEKDSLTCKARDS